MARDDRMREDHAGIGPEPGSSDRLHRLSESQHYRIAGGEPDIRGWEVRTLTGSHLGEVEDLLIDPHRGEVVMLDVDLNDSDDRIRMPIRNVQLDRSRRCVIVDTGDISAARDVATARDITPAPERDVRYGQMRESSADTDDVVEETVVERRPIVEEVVVRRRAVDDTGDSRA